MLIPVRLLLSLATADTAEEGLEWYCLVRRLEEDLEVPVVLAVLLTAALAIFGTILLPLRFLSCRHRYSYCRTFEQAARKGSLEQENLRDEMCSVEKDSGFDETHVCCCWWGMRATCELLNRNRRK